MSFLHNFMASHQEINNAVSNLVSFACVLPDPLQELTVQSNPLKSFSIFEKLPPEIRLMVWRAALPPPQLVWLDIEAFWLRSDTSKYFQNAPPLPSTLHATHESRAEFLHHYRLFWTIAYYRGSWDLPRWAVPIERRPSRPICIDLAHDMVTTWGFCNLRLPNIIGPDMCHGYMDVQSVVLEGVTAADQFLFEVPYYVPLLDGIWSLKKLVLIACKEEASDWYKDAGQLGSKNMRKKVEAYMRQLQIDNPIRSVPEVVMLPAQPITNALCLL